MANAIRPHWIAVDWGTTHMRAYAMSGDGVVLSQAHGPGMGALASGLHDGDFEAALGHAIAPCLESGCHLPVIACGMVGSRQGWQEASYLPVPQNLGAVGSALTRVNIRDAALSVWIVPGLSQAAPSDVMRGEESQLAGYVSHKREQGDSSSGCVCLPGTHAKWARVEGETVVSFATAMTGEVFDLLTEQSILAHSVSTDIIDADAFAEAVVRVYQRPAKLSQLLFSVRAQGLLQGEDGARARAQVSGYLIGAELAAVELEAGETVSIIGTPALGEAYGKALEAIGHAHEAFDGEAMVLSGLSDIYRQLQASERLSA